MSDHTAKLVPVLDGSNYNAWYKAMKAYLMAHSLWGYANGDITRPDTDDEDWVKQNSVAIGNMVLRVKESIQQDVIDLDTAEEVWIRLKDSYGTPTSTSIYKDFKEALSLRINPNSHPGPQIDKMSAAFQRLSAAKMIIPNQVQAMILLAALPRNGTLLSPLSLRLMTWTTSSFPMPTTRFCRNTMLTLLVAKASRITPTSCLLLNESAVTLTFLISKGETSSSRLIMTNNSSSTASVADVVAKAKRSKTMVTLILPTLSHYLLRPHPPSFPMAL